VKEHLLNVSNLYVERSSIPVLRDVSITIKKGEAVCIIGANCAGKSTLFLTIMGLLQPSKGSIHLNNTDITALPTYERVNKGLVLVTAERDLFWNLTVEENLKAATRFRKEAQREWKDSLKIVYDLFPVLLERKKQKAASLSGGEQQMLSIARAIMLQPEILLLDEPSTGLAPLIVSKVYEVIKGLRNRGLTILLAEQNTYYALQASDRGYVLENGNIVLEGTTESLSNNPLIKSAYLGL
jgi:branched-chain amino acid transport system ATP-binding protein